MKSDPAAAIAAAKRLSSTLPKREHRLCDDKAAPRGARAVVIEGRTYPSLGKAAKAHGISIAALQKWIDKGRANYL